METKMIKANPTREFFVNMLVRDILLKQAIIELIDNSIDGAILYVLIYQSMGQLGYQKRADLKK